jgi:hypothetical protein
MEGTKQAMALVRREKPPKAEKGTSVDSAATMRGAWVCISRPPTPQKARLPRRRKRGRRG